MEAETDIDNESSLRWRDLIFASQGFRGPWAKPLASEDEETCEPMNCI